MAKTTKTISFDDERDAALLAWLDGQANASQAVRDALQAAMAGTHEVTLADVYEAVRGVEQVLREGGAREGTARRARTGDAAGTAAAAVNLSQLGL